MTSAKIYGVYLAWVFVMGGITFFFYHRLRNTHKWNSLVPFAYMFGGFFLFQFLVIVVTMVVAVSLGSDSIKDSFLLDQMKNNGGVPPK